MQKCDCYHTETKIRYTYHPITGSPIGHDVEVGVCWGTKECEECSCGGNETRCDFYPEVRKNGRKKKTPKFGEWISVKDRLPEKGGTYLVHYHDDIMGEYVITREYWEKAEIFAPMEYFEEHTGRKAMHWMPLPQPPKGE